MGCVDRPDVAFVVGPLAREFFVFGCAAVVEARYLGEEFVEGVIVMGGLGILERWLGKASSPEGVDVAAEKDASEGFRFDDERDVVRKMFASRLSDSSKLILSLRGEDPDDDFHVGWEAVTHRDLFDEALSSVSSEFSAILRDPSAMDLYEALAEEPDFVSMIPVSLLPSDFDERLVSASGIGLACVPEARRTEALCALAIEDGLRWGETLMNFVPERLRSDRLWERLSSLSPSSIPPERLLTEELAKAKAAALPSNLSRLPQSFLTEGVFLSARATLVESGDGRSFASLPGLSSASKEVRAALVLRDLHDAIASASASKDDRSNREASSLKYLLPPALRPGLSSYADAFSSGLRENDVVGFLRVLGNVVRLVGDEGIRAASGKLSFEMAGFLSERALSATLRQGYSPSAMRELEIR
jgi:hypothetical protein